MVVIVGAGCFGLSTAYHLLKRGHTNVTVLDRSPVLPAPEAASTDINKIVRSSYADIFYSRFARDALAQWKDRDEWADCYHESGVLVLLTGKGSYGDLALANDRALGARTVLLPESSDDPSEAAPPHLPRSLRDLLKHRSGYINQDGGWVHSSRAIELLMDKVAKLGGSIIAGKAVQSLLKDPSTGKTIGVKCADGSEFKSDVVVLASGAWTPSAFPELKVEDKCIATAQIVGKIQLTPEEADRHRADPVYLDLDSAFYMFPPNDQNIIKCAIHGAGFTHRSTPNSISTPVFPAPPSQDQKEYETGQFETAVPRAVLQELRGQLARTSPEFADKPWVGTRMCWYTDSADEDWLIGYHPLDRGVMFATAGSGHAMKFLPNIGSLVADAIEGKMDAELVKRFAFDRAKKDVTSSRPGKEVQELEISDLVGPS